ncbi:MAG: carboxypeptidase M32, partial [Limisphaerales bacterium]
EQGFKAEHVATPMGESVSLGIHESQSRLWENKVGRSLAFWEDWYDAACRHLPSLQSFSPEQITLAVNRVSPSFIRVEADEVTYDLHIILRYEMEKALIAGDLQVKDVPGEWNERFKSMFGLEVPNDAQGCLQDIHWSMGGFGYFPTYTLGNLNSAQLFASARSALGPSLHHMDQGAYVALLDWLRRQVHQHGRQHEPDELMKLATGKSTDPLMHQAYLKERFDSLSA